MPLRWQIDHQQKFVHIVAEGPVTIEQMEEHFDAIVVDCENEQNATLLFKSARNSGSNQSALAVAVVEGQAMVVLVDYMLEPMGLSLKDSPQVVQSLKDGMLVGTDDAVQFQNAPIYMKEALTCPDRYGIDFIAGLRIKGGKDKAFAELFRNPPRTTRQIMEPQTYLSGERLEQMNVPDFRQVLKNYERFDIGGRGPLAGERPRVVNARLERMDRAAQCVDRQRRRDVGRARDLLGRRERQREHGRGRLRAVDERQPFLRAEPDRRQPGALQGLCAGDRRR